MARIVPTLLGPALLLAMLVAPARAELPTRTTKAKVEVELVSDRTALSPGEVARVGVKLRPEEGWHIYWKFPGDTGLPTRVDFEAPDGFAFEEMRWPVPQRFVDKLGGRSYGFERELVLYSEVRIPEDLQEGTTATISARVGWLVCKENCIQGNATVGLTLPIRAVAPEERTNPAGVALFDGWSQRHPRLAAEGPKTSALVTGAPVAPGAGFTVDLEVEAPAGATWHEPLAEAFIPETEGLEIVDISKIETSASKLGLRLTGKASSQPELQPAKLAGILRLKTGAETLAWETSFPVERAPAPAEPVAQGSGAAGVPGAALATSGIGQPRPVIGEPCADIPPLDRSDDGKLSSFALALLFAFLGGLILNAMPCVLPVLSLKILGIVEQAKDSPQTVWRHGLFYTAGVLASFLVMAILLIALQQTSWAFQFQDPVFVGVFTAIVFAFSLSLFGVFEIALPGASKIDAAVAGSHGYASSFNYGIFAVLLGTPCTAPFLGPALTYAFTQPPFEMTLLLLSVGLGLASPFLLLARFPGWRKILPRPGAWLITFKKVMAFLLVGTAVFLLSIFAAQVSREALVSYLVFLTLLALSLFIYGNWTEPSRSPRVRWTATAVALGLTVWSAVTFVSVDPPEGTGPTMTAGGITWHDFDRIDVNAKASDGHLVFVDFTADWCTTCKVNEATAIHTDEVRDLIHALGVLPVKGDFTQYKPEIAKWLEKYEEPSVPLYVVIPPGRPDEAFKLPTLLSESDVKSGLCDAYRLANASR